MQDNAADVLLALWDHLHPEPKMDGSSVVTRSRISADLCARVLEVAAGIRLKRDADDDPDDLIRSGYGW